MDCFAAAGVSGGRNLSLSCTAAVTSSTHTTQYLAPVAVYVLLKHDGCQLADRQLARAVQR